MVVSPDPTEEKVYGAPPTADVSVMVKGWEKGEVGQVTVVLRPRNISSWGRSSPSALRRYFPSETMRSYDAEAVAWR